MIHGSKFELHSVFVKNTTRLNLFRKAGSFPRPRVFAFAFAFLVVLAVLCVAVVTGGIVVRSSTWSPAVCRPMSSSASVQARVDVCLDCVVRVGRAISFLVLVFAFDLDHL